MVVMAAEPTMPAAQSRIPKRSLGIAAGSVIAILVLSGITINGLNHVSGYTDQPIPIAVSLGDNLQGGDDPSACPA